MITKLFIENYRSIQKADLSLGKINVLTGANNSGKSSVLYAALTLKSLVSNPNRSLDAILTLPFINLGGFEQIVYLKDKAKRVGINCLIKTNDDYIGYGAFLGEAKSELAIRFRKETKELEIAFPYSSNKLVIFDYYKDKRNSKYNSGSIKGTETKWNGFYFESNSVLKDVIEKKEIEAIDRYLNEPINQINSIDFTPNQRGFTQAFFGAVPLQSQITTEEEIATLIATDRDLASLIEYYFEKIVDKTFRVDFTLGTANFYLRTRDKQTGFTTDLVNEGTGINQLVTILAKTLKKDSDFICIDEPEIHLHPTYISKLAKVLVEIAENENKQFLISTHSEHLVSSLLNLLITKDLKPDDLHVFYCSKKGKSTEIEQQEVNDKGQIAGGFKSFIDAELQNTKTFFQIK
jgi:predicted ATPase